MTVNDSVSAPLLSAQVADEIRVLLTRQRRSGRWLASTLGVSQTWLSSRLTGGTPIDLNDLQRIAAALEVEYVDLLPQVRLTTAGGPQADHRTGTNARSNRPAERPNLSGQRQRADERESSRRPARRFPFVAERMPDDLMAELTNSTAA